MLRLPSAKEGTYQDPPTGLHPAICIAIIDLGTQPQMYNGQPKAPARMFQFKFELCGDDVMADGRRFVVQTSELLFSMSEKSNLRKMLESWRGKAFTEAEIGDEGTFDLSKVLGMPCYINMVEKPNKKGEMKIRIGGVMRLPKGFPKPAPTNDRILFVMLPEYFKADLLEKFSDNLKAKIQASPEWQQLTQGYAAGRNDDDDSDPFGDDDDDDGDTQPPPQKAPPQQKAPPPRPQTQLMKDIDDEIPF